ncbi:MAG: choline dehydrogenase, partial [Aestuariibacter sp.]|nr:choline dehydrogenase [Aestuariibacter sp.]
NPDFNGATQEGVGFYEINTRNGKRMSASRAYLHPARRRPNCEVLSKAHVTRLLFENKKAVGVEYQRQGETCIAMAGREVILSAGSINSPQILQLSGIGPQKLLRDSGISVVHHAAAVGRNMQEHLACTYYYRSRVPTLNNYLNPWWGKMLAGMQYLLTRRGVLSLSVNQAGGFVKSNPQRARPNLQLYFAAMTYTSAPTDERPLMQPDPYPGFLNSISQLRPKSRGCIEIISADPYQAPRIMPNYLSENEDVEEMLEGVRLLRTMANQPALKEVIETEITPGRALDSDDELIDDIRQRCSTVFHPTSTCMMGSDPARSVVNSSCQVYGVDNLRVVDASIFPTVTSGNTNAPTIMAAEKAADLILEHSS